jgi:hypothetical protein
MNEVAVRRPLMTKADRHTKYFSLAGGTSTRPLYQDLQPQKLSILE